MTYRTVVYATLNLDSINTKKRSRFGGVGICTFPGHKIRWPLQYQIGSQLVSDSIWTSAGHGAPIVTRELAINSLYLVGGSYLQF